MIFGLVNKSRHYQSTSWQDALRACPLIIGEHFHAKTHLEAVVGHREALVTDIDKCSLRGHAVRRIIDRLSEACGLGAWRSARMFSISRF